MDFPTSEQWAKICSSAGVGSSDVAHVRAETENQDYGAARISFGANTWQLRVGKLTPTKPGAFVSFWTRDPAGQSAPYPADHGFAGLLVYLRCAEQAGVFAFTAGHLQELGITSSAQHPGKRGFRIYPPWCAELNPQARRSQRAQARAFSATPLFS